MAAIVWNTLNDCQARPAASAIRERVTKAARKRIEDFRAAIVTGRGVRRDAGSDGRRGALFNGESCLANQWPHRTRDRTAVHLIHSRQRRRFRFQSGDESLKVFGLSACQYFHALAVIRDMAANVMQPRQPPDRGAKTDALHQTPHGDSLGDQVLKAFGHLKCFRIAYSGGRNHGFNGCELRSAAVGNLIQLANGGPAFGEFGARGGVADKIKPLAVAFGWRLLMIKWIVVISGQRSRIDFSTPSAGV
jgi:hypothetical protein